MEGRRFPAGPNDPGGGRIVRGDSGRPDPATPIGPRDPRPGALETHTAPSGSAVVASIGGELPRSLLDEQLDILSLALQDGADLGAILAVLIDDLTEAVPSFLGLQMTVVADGEPLTLSTLIDGDDARVRASLRLPLDLMGVATGATAVVYAAEPGVLRKLAETTREKFDLDGQVVEDGDLPPAGDPQVIGLAELSAVNQALGMLVEDGYTPEDARDILRRRAPDTHPPDRGCGS